MKIGESLSFDVVNDGEKKTKQQRFGTLWARADMFTFSFISSAMRCHLTLSQFFWDRIQPETFWLGGRKPWPATLFLIREYLKFSASPKELCETGMAAFDLCGEENFLYHNIKRVCKCKRRSYNVTSHVCASAREDLTT